MELLRLPPLPGNQAMEGRGMRERDDVRDERGMRDMNERDMRDARDMRPMSLTPLMSLAPSTKGATNEH